MTPDMVNRRWYIEDEQKGKIAQVCSDPATSPQQKHDKINQIHADTDRELAKLIPSDELATFNRCQAELDQRRPKSAAQKTLGPCGGVVPDGASSDAPSAPQHSHTSAPNSH